MKDQCKDETCTNMWKYCGVKAFIKVLEDHKKLTASRIASMYDLTTPEVRTYIKYIRTNSIHFMGHKRFLVADNKGYYISRDMKIIKKFLEKLHKTGQEMLLQVHQGWVVTKKVDKDGLVRRKKNDEQIPK